MYKYKKKSKEECVEEFKQLTDKLYEGVTGYMSSYKYKELLNTLEKFSDYSTNNVILIGLQKPDATYVAGYNSWKINFNRHVKKGEMGIKIIAPMPFEKEILRKELDKYNNFNYEIIDGSSEDKCIIKGINYRITNVFDVSQTDQIEGKPAIELTPAKQLTDDVFNYEKLKKVIEGVSPVKVTYESFDGLANGYFSPIEEKIVIKKGMSQSQTIKTLLHEVSHAMLHSGVEKSSRNFYFVGDNGEKISNLSLRESLEIYNKGSFGTIGISVKDAQNDTKYEVDLLKNNELLMDNINKNETVSNDFEVQKSLYDISSELLNKSDLRSIRELQAESTAYIVANKLGIDTSNYSFGYITSWSRDSPKLILETLDSSRVCSLKLYEEIEKNLEQKTMIESKESINTFELATKIDAIMRENCPELYLKNEQFPGQKLSEIHSELRNNRSENILNMLNNLSTNNELFKEKVDELLGNLNYENSIYKMNNINEGGFKL